MLMRYEFDALPLDTKYGQDDAIQSQLRAIIRTIGVAALAERVAIECYDAGENWPAMDRDTVYAMDDLAMAIDDAIEKFEDATDAA